MLDHFKQTVEGFDLRLEKNTDSVPRDGKFHIIHQGCVVFSSKSFPQTRKKFWKILSEMGYDPKIRGKSKDNNIKQLVERDKAARFFQSYEQYWGSSHKFKNGGRLGKR
ncbi:MAG: hypothetical protein KJ770_01295 [Actinobacteria bacterium]|nr:hypothetical protein [Actinomycetota bacterium]